MGVNVSASRPRIQPWSLWLIAAIMLGGVFVAFNYVKRNRAEADDPRPAYLGKLERNLTGQNRDGATLELASLKGQIWVASYLSTESPERAPAVARALRPVWNEFAQTPGFHFVTLAVHPEGDTPERRNEFLRNHGVDHPRWWFLATDDETEMSRFVLKYLRMMPTRPVTDPAQQREWGPYQHDLRVALIDGKANVRGLYQLLHPESGEAQRERLRHDITYLLREKGSATAAEAGS